MNTPTMTSYKHHLITADGHQMDVWGGPEESVIEAAENAGVLLPSSCRAGNCGACHASAEGDYVLGQHSRTVLADEAAARGGVLLCRTYPRGTLTIDLPYEQGRILFGTIPQRTATIAAVTTVAADTVRLELQLGPDPQEGSGCEFDPGQFFELTPPESGIRRSYSLANIPNWDGIAEFYIKLRASGAFSDYLRRAAPGQTLIARGPQGAFGLHDTGLRPRWFIAGGTGLAPLLSMLRRMAEWEEPHPARLYFGVETEEEIYATDVLEDLAGRLPDFRYDIVVHRPTAEWKGAVGTPIDSIADDLAHAHSAPDMYLCGPPGMVSAARKKARQAGITDDRINVENFAPSAR